MASTLFGSAAFSDFDGYSFKDIANGSNVIFGRGFTKENLWYGSSVNKHFLSVAPTRSGKGAALIIPNLLLYRGSSIVIDPKGENAYVTAEARRKMGQKTHIIDPWEETNRRYGSKSGILEEVATFNPLSILDPNDPNFSDDIAYIADSLIINQGGGDNKHFDDSARELIAGLVAFIVLKHGDEASLPLVRLMLSKPLDELEGLAAEACEMGDTLAARKLGRFKIIGKEGASIVSTALTQTAFLDSAPLGKNMEKSSFSFEDVVAGKATIYLVLPVDKLQTYGRWLRLMISIGIRTIARNTKRLDLPVLFFLDEFGTIGKLSAVSQAVGLMAGLQMCIWVFIQDLIQLKRDYPNEWETFIANAGAFTCFDIMDQLTAEYISKMLGQSTVERASVATAQKRKGDFFGGGDPSYSSMNDQYFSRALATPDEVRRLHSSNGFIITNGNPVIFKKTYYFNNLFFFKLCRPNPNFKTPKESDLIYDKEKNVLDSVGKVFIKILRAIFKPLFLRLALLFFLSWVFGGGSILVLDHLTHGAWLYDLDEYFVVSWAVFSLWWFFAFFSAVKNIDFS